MSSKIPLRSFSLCLQKITRHCQVLGCSLELVGKTVFFEDITNFNHRTQRNQDGANLETSFLLDNFHNAKKWFVCYHSRKVITNMTRLGTTQATIIINLVRYVAWCNSGRNIGVLSNHILNIFKVRYRSWYLVPILVPRTGHGIKSASHNISL